jgi:hypothetical protein
MAAQSQVSQAFHAAFEGAFLPLLRTLGFVVVKPKNVKPGTVVAQAQRAIDATRRLEVTLWSGPGKPLDFRFDRVEPINGVECTGEIPLVTPWPDPAYSRPPQLSLAANELRPHESPERLAAAIEFLAGAFASAVDAPELSADLEAARHTDAWREAIARAKAHWERRHLRGEINDRVVKADIVFVGAQILMVDAEGARLTFRFDTKELDRSQPVSVTRWFKTPAGTVGALRLVNGSKAWDFDARGELKPS